MIELRLRRSLQHQSHPATIEKGQPRRSLEQQLEPQHILIKRRRPFDILDIDCDLPHAFNSDSDCAHVQNSPFKSDQTSQYNGLLLLLCSFFVTNARFLLVRFSLV